MSARHLYIVDDDDVVRASLRGLMSTQPGLEIREFSSGDRFLEAMHDLEPGCLLLDLLMPGRQGMEVLQIVSRESARFAVLGAGLQGHRLSHRQDRGQAGLRLHTR